MSKGRTPGDLQIVGLVAAILITASFVELGGSIDGALRLFLVSLPTCAIGLAIFKLIVRDKFEKPKSWPEWILLYVVGMLAGGPPVALVVFGFKRIFG